MKKQSPAYVLTLVLFACYTALLVACRSQSTAGADAGESGSDVAAVEATEAEPTQVEPASHAVSDEGAVAEATQAPQQTILEILAADDRFEVFSELFGQLTQDDEPPTISRIINDPEHMITLFAPTDDAFAEMPEETMEALRADRAQLALFLQRHVATGRLHAEAIATLKVLSVGGRMGAVTVEGGADALQVSGATIIEADIEAINGVIHVVDKVIELQPEADE